MIDFLKKNKKNKIRNQVDFLVGTKQLSLPSFAVSLFLSLAYFEC